MTWRLLKSKLSIPVVRSRFVSRFRLIEQLNAGMAGKLLLVSAPAGFGKTMLLASWAELHRKHVAWLSLDRIENDPVLFCRYLVKTIQTVCATIGNAAMETLRPMPQVPTNEFLSVLVSEIEESSETFLVVLDDYHVIENPSIHKAISFLLDRLPSNMILVLSSRSTPPIPLSRLRAGNQLTELGPSDLRFLTKEVEIFFNTIMGFDLEPADIATLQARTEGWITGLQMAALSMQGRNNIPSFIASFSGNNVYVVDYLASEVLMQLPSDVQTFLLDTSILTYLSASICNAVTGRKDSQQILERLDADNLFMIPLDDSRQQYRYHTLFADSLQNRLRCRFPDRFHMLHKRASQWYDQNNYTNYAVIHILATGETEKAVELLEKHCAAILSRGEKVTVQDWLTHFPESLIRSRPLLCLIHAWILVSENDPAARRQIEPRLKEVERLLSDSGGLNNSVGPVYLTKRKIACFITMIRLWVAHELPESPEFILGLAHQMLSQLSEDDHDLRSVAFLKIAIAYLRKKDFKTAYDLLADAISAGTAGNVCHSTVLSAFHQAWIAIQYGDLIQAEKICKGVMGKVIDTDIQSQRDVPVMGALYVCLGTIEYEKSRLQSAVMYLEKGLSLLSSTMEFGAIIYGYGALALTRYVLERDLTESRRILEKIASMANRRSGALIYVAALNINLLVWDATFNNDYDKLSEAESIARKHGLNLVGWHKMPDHFQEDGWHRAAQFALVRLSIAQALQRTNQSVLIKTEPVLAFLEQQLNKADQKGLGQIAIEASLLQALALSASGQRDQAIVHVSNALNWAETNLNDRCFMNEGKPMADLLTQLIKRDSHNAYGKRLIKAIEKEIRGQKPEDTTLESSYTPIDPLSARELEVLKLIAIGHSNKDIATELYIAQCTVKTHLKNIYSKLNIHTRVQAMVQAKKLDLI